MGDTADWLNSHPWEDPDLWNEMQAEFRDMTGWQKRIDAERNPKKRRALEQAARDEFMGSIESEQIKTAHGWND